jgi:signal transduction histidine kinase/HD-like signal output (HDOD) protein
MGVESILAGIVKNPRLPAPAPVALKILEKASRPDCALAEIGSLISLDPGLCARILQIVNSAFFTLPYKVGTISRALNLLGLKRVRALVLSLALPAMRRRSGDDAAMRDYWKASVTAAVAAREWAARARLADPDNEMVSALLCDLGTMILREVNPEGYARLLIHPAEALLHRQCELEEFLLGVNHAEVSSYVLHHWGLPEEMTEAIRFHHRPAASPSAVIAERADRLHFAGLIGQLQLAPLDSLLVTQLLHFASERFHLDGPALEKFLEPLQKRVEEFASLLHVDIGPTNQHPVLLAGATEQLARLASETALENIRVHQEKDQSDDLRRRGEEELERLSRQQELILNAAGEGIFGLDRHGFITFVNPAAARLLGRDPHDLIGTVHPERTVKNSLSPVRGGEGWGEGGLLSEAIPLTPNPSPRSTGEKGAGSLASESSAIRSVLDDGQVRQVEVGLFARADESTFPVRYTCAPIQDAGEIVGAVVTFQDVSALQEAREALRRSEEQLRQAQKMEVIGQLAGGVAHDFNNLLTIITGYSDLLLNGGLAPDDPACELVSEIMKAGERAASLTRQLLAFSRKQVLAPKVLLLNTVVDDLDKMLRRLIGEDINLCCALAADLGMVRADSGQIEQVITNLIVNARDALPPRGGQITIETANVALDETYTLTHPGVPPGQYIMLAVTDNGSGMDAATQARIFEPFFTTKGPGKGTGLGLATIYGIVKQSGGSIYVYSEPGRGTSFKIYLPRIADLSVPAAAVAPSLSPHGRETLLLVEDDDSVRSLMRTTLHNSDYEILEAPGPVEALRWAEEHTGRIHLLVTDLIMPVMSGRVLSERLTSLRPDVKVLYLSGYTDDAVVRHGLLEEEVAFLQKPFTPHSLACKVREVLDQC